MLINNYRPVSILPFSFPKILEKLMYNRLISFINTHKLLSKYQFDFRKGHSTSYALITLVDRLSLNINKTHFMVFKSQKSNVNYDVLYINNMTINKVERTKFFGVIIDGKLNWTHHITYVKGKLSRGIGIICKARKVLKKETIIKLYYSLFYPFLAYCIEVWGNTFHNYIESIIFKLQKKLYV